MLSAGCSIILFSFFAMACAHMQLRFPPGIQSTFDTQTRQSEIDYSRVSPLATSGSDYPCHGRATPEIMNSLQPVATLTANTPFTMLLAGSVTHHGGSCQISVSYDSGVSFAVIASLIGGCPLNSEYTINIPDLPSKGKAIFAWDWFNRVGVREHYQDCAIVNIVGSARSFSAPAAFRANSLGNSCIVPEGIDVVFSSPGSQVVYGGAESPQSAVTSLSGCLGDRTVTLSAGSEVLSSDAPGVASLVSGPATPVLNLISVPVPETNLAPASASPSIESTPVTPVTVIKSVLPSDLLPVIPSGSHLLCTSATTFSLCDEGLCYVMGNVADGTVCRDNAITWGKKRSFVNL